MFNLLTGLNQKIANYPGVTVESKSGFVKLYNTAAKKWEKIELIDLPGIYSLEAISDDEEQAVKSIRSYASTADKEDVLVLFVADTGNPSRSLHLFFALKDLGFKMVLLLNMAYMAKQKGVQPHVETIMRELETVPVIISDRSRNKTANSVKETVRNFGEIRAAQKPLQSYDDYVTKAAEKQSTWFSIQSVSIKQNVHARADQVFMHPVWGPLIFLALMFLIFQSLFSLSAYPMNWIETAMVRLEVFLSGVLPQNELSALLVDGILPGITGVLVFIPQIAFLFMFISIMEETGYLARVTFLADNLMRRFGMNGKSLIPFAGGAACAVPAIMSARTISNRRERLITILMTPWVTCSARLPVFVTLIAVFVPEGKTGFLSTRGLVLAAFYLLGIMAVFIGAFLLNLILKKEKKRSLFMMELPDYRLPLGKTVIKEVWQKVRDFVWNAGKIIVAISVVLWVLASYGPKAKMQAVDEKYASQQHTHQNLKEIPGYRSEKLEQSYAGHFGKVIEPVIEPLGFDWKIGIGLLTSFAAREVFVGTMNTIYGLGSDADEKKLSEVLSSQKDAAGKKIFDAATSISLMIFFLLAMQCMSTFAVVRRETGSLKIALSQLAVMTLTAYLASLAVYRLMLLL